MKKLIVISAVNLTEGGPLVILQECLNYLSSSDLLIQYEIIALVNNKKFCLYDNINYIEVKKAKTSWFHRLYYEYYYFNKLAKRYRPYLWMSLHDITPNVKADRVAVYCHNSSPFYKVSFKEAMMSPRFALFNNFYKYLYAINIKKNDFVIVQQNWMRREFVKLFKLETVKVIVANPTFDIDYFMENHCKITNASNGFTFFYPSLSRVFKNHEVICRASEILLKQKIHDFQVIFTISGSDNQYSKYIYNSFKHLKNIKFLGIQSRDRVLNLYQASDCVIFSSKLETWGIPITEAKYFNKPLLLADLEYAHETLGKYDKAVFFDPDSPEQLADLMKSMINRTIVYENAEFNVVSGPFSQNWKSLFDILLSSNLKNSSGRNTKVQQLSNV